MLFFLNSVLLIFPKKRLNGEKMRNVFYSILLFLALFFVLLLSCFLLIFITLEVTGGNEEVAETVVQVYGIVLVVMGFSKLLHP